jgi:hypothetical protein
MAVHQGRKPLVVVPYGFLIEPVRQHLTIDAVLFQGISGTLATLLTLDVRNAGNIGRDNGATAS